jgi:hypothetical protein
MELDKVCEESDADWMDNGRECESLAELKRVGKGLCNAIVARVVGNNRIDRIGSFCWRDTKGGGGSTYMIDL